MSILNQQEGVEEDNDSDSDDDEEDSISPTDQETVLSAVSQEVCEEDPVHIDNDLKLLCKEGIADDCTMQRLHRCKESIAPKKVSSSAVPLYYPQEIERKPAGITPFVEVCIKGHTFMVRKTTAIWLFQESERVSADRLFRVRDKQPFATSTSKAPDIPNYTLAKALPVIQVGELCVMKVSNSWKLGRVLQFAKRDSSKNLLKATRTTMLQYPLKRLGFFVHGMKHLMMIIVCFI